LYHEINYVIFCFGVWLHLATDTANFHVSQNRYEGSGAYPTSFRTVNGD